MHGYFSIGACKLCLYFYLLLFKTCLECTSSTLDVMDSMLPYFRPYEYTSLPPPSGKERARLVLTSLLYNIEITLVIFYDLLNTWYLQNLSQLYLLTSQILYLFVKHMQRHVNNEHCGKTMNT